MNYQTLKQLAADTPGVRVADLIALAPANDPFYCGSDGEIAKAQWFAGLWDRFSYSHGIHLRRVHYQLVSQTPPIVKPNGQPYENTTNDWAYLMRAAKSARYLGLVDPNAFVDRRNPDPHLYRAYYETGDPQYELDAWRDADVQLPEWPELPRFVVSGYEVEQPYHLEIWVEKTTMNDVLRPLCRHYAINLVTGAGELSITAALDFVKRVQQADRPARIFYIADFDPAGHGMPVSIARKVEYFLQDMSLDLDIRLQPIALTLEQVRQYRLPRTPIKPSELRKQRFENTFGAGAVELDALEALHPGLLAQIVREHVNVYYDSTLDSRAREQYWKLKDALNQAYAGALEPFEEELDELEQTFHDAIDEFMSAIGAVTNRLPDLHAEIRQALQAIDVDLDDYPIPEPKQAGETGDLLFDSARTYSDQLTFYKAYRNGHDPTLIR